MLISVSIVFKKAQVKTLFAQPNAFLTRKQSIVFLVNKNN